jgi:hypothetical protein
VLAEATYLRTVRRVAEPVADSPSTDTVGGPHARRQAPPGGGHQGGPPTVRYHHASLSSVEGVQSSRCFSHDCCEKPWTRVPFLDWIAPRNATQGQGVVDGGGEQGPHCKIGAACPGIEVISTMLSTT